MRTWRITYQLKDDPELYTFDLLAVNRIMAYEIFEEFDFYKDVVAIRCDLVEENK